MAGEAHAAWAFFHPDGRFDHWYVNFQAPFRRRPDAVETSDHGIDIVVLADRWEWKDRDDPDGYVRTGRFTRAEADAVYAEADRVARQLERGERWWMTRWGDWRPRTREIRARGWRPTVVRSGPRRSRTSPPA